MSTETKIEPALTPEEWTEVDAKRWLTVENNDIQRGADADGEYLIIYPNGEGAAFQERRNAVAALLLYGQPFGFTQEDVDALLESIGNDRQSANAACERAERVAAKIAALLPPHQ
jgi:hypothetical protein